MLHHDRGTAVSSQCYCNATGAILLWCRAIWGATYHAVHERRLFFCRYFKGTWWRAAAQGRVGVIAQQSGRWAVVVGCALVFNRWTSLARPLCAGARARILGARVLQGWMHWSATPSDNTWQMT